MIFHVGLDTLGHSIIQLSAAFLDMLLSFSVLLFSIIFSFLAFELCNISSLL